MPSGERLLTLGVIGGCQAALDNAPGGFNSAGSNNTFGGAAGAEHHINTGSFAAGGDSASDVTIKDNAGTGTAGADFFDQLGVAGAVKHAHGQFVDLFAFSLGDQVQVLFHGQAQVYEVCGLGAGYELLHVEHGGGVKH